MNGRPVSVRRVRMGVSWVGVTSTAVSCPVPRAPVWSSSAVQVSVNLQDGEQRRLNGEVNRDMPT